MATLVKKMHPGMFSCYYSIENVNVRLSAEGHAPNDVPNTHNVEGKMSLEINTPQPLLMLS
jgi:hypothetical protein